MTRKTYQVAQCEILVYLAELGWTVKDRLKVPHATSPDGGLRLWFRPQAVRYTRGNAHVLGNAHSLFVDIRTFKQPIDFLLDTQLKLSVYSVAGTDTRKEKAEELATSMICNTCGHTHRYEDLCKGEKYKVGE